MKIKIGSFFYERNKQEPRINRRYERGILHDLKEYAGFEKKVFCLAVHLELNAMINLKDLNQSSTDKICDSIMESISMDDVIETAAEKGVSSEDPCCFRVALYITINGKQLPFLTDYKKTEKIEIERAFDTALDVYRYDPKPVIKDKLWRDILDEDFIQNPERPPVPPEFAKFFGNNPNVRISVGDEEKEERNTKTFIFGCMDPEDVHSYNDEIKIFQSTLENMKAQVRDEIRSALKPEFEVNCSGCTMM